MSEKKVKRPDEIVKDLEEFSEAQRAIIFLVYASKGPWVVEVNDEDGCYDIISTETVDHDGDESRVLIAKVYENVDAAFILWLINNFRESARTILESIKREQETKSS